MTRKQVSASFPGEACEELFSHCCAVSAGDRQGLCWNATWLWMPRTKITPRKSLWGIWGWNILCLSHCVPLLPLPLHSKAGSTVLECREMDCQTCVCLGLVNCSEVVTHQLVMWTSSNQNVKKKKKLRLFKIKLSFLKFSKMILAMLFVLQFQNASKAALCCHAFCV